jgi:uncharacterized short protein YbdD (DUF466 family)
MKTLIYKIKNKLYRFSKEAKKLERPSFEQLLHFENFQKGPKNKLALSFGAGRCGQNWFAKIFNSHQNWIGSCERFSEFESFYRYITYYDLPINKEGIYKLFLLASKMDMAKFQNTFIASPYLSFGVEEFYERLKPDYIFFNIRDPIKSIESFYSKGWYFNTSHYSDNSPLIDSSVNLERTFSRIIPNNSYYFEWEKLTRIGKITWFWSTINRSIFNDFKKIEKVEKFFIKLKDIDKNYEIYLKMREKFKFKNVMTKKEFFNVINKAPNKSLKDKYEFKNWTTLEKKEFEKIKNKFFPFYETIKTNI